MSRLANLFRTCSVLVFIFMGSMANAGDRDVPLKDRRVLVISVDGLRPDLLLRANTPNLHQMLTDGVYTMWAQTTAVAVTMPSHVSMLTGVRPQIHQIEWNHDIPLQHVIYPAVPTLFQKAKAAGYTTAMVAGKSKFECLVTPDTFDVAFVPTQEMVPDQTVLDKVLPILAEPNPPQVMFVHLPETDQVGHAIGWGTPQQMTTISHADWVIGTILDALRKRKLLDSTLVIISADHGGAGRQHGADDVRSRCIPWIAMGPGLRQGLDLTSVYPNRTVRTEDTFATACDFLGIPVKADLDGKPVQEIYDRAGQELMLAEPAPEKSHPTVATTEPVGTNIK